MLAFVDASLNSSAIENARKEKSFKIGYNSFLLLLREVPLFLKDHFEKESAFPK